MKNVYLLFRSYSLIVISLFVVLVTVMVANLNPKATDQKVLETKAPGDIVAHIVWPNGDIDVDLWLSGPDEPVPVGYSNKGGVLWNLLRDDLGNKPDATPINYEDAFTRGIVPGEYVVNIQCWRCHLATFPMTVDVAVSMRNRSGDQPLENFVVSKVLIKQDGQEKTAVRFIVKEDRTVAMDSINNTYKPLRGSNKPSGGLTFPYYLDGGGVSK